MQQVVLKAGLLRAMSAMSAICMLSPRHSNFSAIRSGRSLHEELQRRQHQQVPFGSMTSYASHLLNAELQQQEIISRGGANKPKYQATEHRESTLNLGNVRGKYRLGKDSKARLIENPLQVLLKHEDKHTGSMNNAGISRLNRFNSNRLLHLIDDELTELKGEGFGLGVGIGDGVVEGVYCQWPDQLKACEAPRRCPYCSGDEGHIAARPLARKRPMSSAGDELQLSYNYKA